ncbi:hypothetical protein PV11_08645 [Exophiala sideris]|uniref:Uncharacterized protein n=1 Tax=Exophiala sideris TaxID=1016849 RepID=A0A0D1Z2V3_9EURO|nr:hypothetical protein PV11_08645 [Exophiala sideris]
MEQLTALTNLEMAPQQAHPPVCLTHGIGAEPITPPATPPLLFPKAVSRLQLSKLLRRSRSMKSKHEEVKIKTPTIHSRPSVAEMKAPFPLLLPNSPSLTEEATPMTASSSSLRRMSISYNDLRALAQQHTSSSPVTTLLPSPITSEPHSDGRSYFKFQSPWAPKPNSSEELFDNLQIVSYYCNEEATDMSNHVPSVQESASSDDEQSTASESMPVTPSGHGNQDPFCSNESGWLANTTSHEERQRRFKSRFYQVVQRPWTDGCTEDGDEQVMVATILVGLGKPKIVQIHRPSSRPTSPSSPIECQPVPATPIQPPVEVSAFSPYDTPGEVPLIGSQLSKAVSPGPETATTSPSSLVPSPLRLTRRMSSLSDSSIFSATLQRLYELADPFTISPRRSPSNRTSLSLPSKWTAADAPRKRDSYQCLSPTHRVATWSKCRRVERAIRAVTRAVDSFPDGMLRLDSPSIIDIRRADVSDHTYIDAFHKIFPMAPALLLSALTAWILVDIYFSKLKEQMRPMERHWAQLAASNESLHQIPDKAREMLGIGLPDTTSIQLNEYMLSKRASVLRVSISVVGQRLIEALRGAWDEDIWRSLKVLVEVIETSPQPW